MSLQPPLSVLPSTMMDLQPLLRQHSQRVHIGGQQICAISGVPRPFGGFLRYLTAHAECIFLRCNRASKHDVHEVMIRQTFILKVFALGHAYMWTTNS